MMNADFFAAGRHAAPLLLLFYAGAVCMDLKEEKIANGWVLTGLVLSVAERVGESLVSGVANPSLAESICSVLLPVALFFPFFVFRMLGAGDIKAMAVIGIFMRPQEMLSFLLTVFLLAGGMAVVKMLRSGNGMVRLIYLQQYIHRYLSTGRKIPYCLPEKKPENLHMACPIFVAVVLWCVAGNL